MKYTDRIVLMAKLTGPEGIPGGASRSSGGIEGTAGKNVQPDFKAQAKINQDAVNNIRKNLNMPKKSEETIKKQSKVEKIKQINKLKKQPKGRY